MNPSLLSMLPFNISLLILELKDLTGMRPIKVLDIMEGGTKNFHPDGMFSVETFGKVGSEQRNRLFSYIDLHVPVFHPVLYKALLDLKELYGNIIAEKAYAVFDPKLKDFVPATVVTGRTGFAFFLEHFHELEFEERPSTSREFNIKLVKKYRNEALMSTLLVMPAGIRDYSVDENGKPTEDEINGLYRRAFSIASMLSPALLKMDPKHSDSRRASLQVAVYEIYVYIANLLQGKSKLIGGWWTTRRVFNSTRNVITSNVMQADRLFAPTTTGQNDTVVGLYQSLQSIFPLAVNLLRGITSHIFPGPNTPAILVDPKTLKKELILVRPEHYDDWVTPEGLMQMINRFEIESLRHDVIRIEGKYLALVYNDGKAARICHGVDELPEGWDPAHLKPITYAELFYMATAERIRSLYSFVTRYPVIGYGGIYPSSIYLKTTINSQCLKILNEVWEPTDSYYNEFPIRGEVFVNSMSPAIAHYPALGSDNDGDMTNFIALMTDESLAEVKALLDTWEYYVSINGTMNFSMDNDVSNLVFATLSA